MSVIVSCLTAAVLGVAAIISCVCGLITWPSAAADADVTLITNPTLLGTIELGEYPQTYVGDSLNATLKTLGNNARTGKTYTSTDDSTEVKWYEYAYNGKKYVKVESVNKGEHQEFMDGTEAVKGEIYFFAVESILWDVFQQDNHIIAVAHDLLGTVSFLALGESNSSWQDSYLRNFLNNNFLNEASFGNYAQVRKYYSSTVDVDNNSSDVDGDLLTDKMWTPSYLEIQNFYTTNDSRVKNVTDYGMVSGNCDDPIYSDDHAVFYFSRTRRIDDNNGMCKIRNTGETYITGGVQFIESYCAAFVLSDATAQHVDHVVAPTCEQQGYTEHYWTINGQQYDYYTDNVTKLADHTYGEWETVTENTCVDDGERRHTCEVCGYTETESVPANNDKHDYTATIVAPTCGKDGYTEHVCQNENCTATYRDNITAALEHAWSDWHTVTEPTATTTGMAERECANCGASEQKNLAALGLPGGTTQTLTPIPTPTTDNNGGQAWLIFGIIAGGVLVLGSVTVSWLFLGLSHRKKQIA